MSESLATLAVVFDFDDTLVPDSTSRLLEAHGVDVTRFWGRDIKKRVRQGYDPSLAYLNAILDLVGEGRPLDGLSPRALRRFGKTLDPDFYPGLPALFRDLRRIVRGFERIEIEFYVISGGLKDVIEGTKIVRDHFTGVYACELDADGPDRPVRQVRRCVTFTEKTRYLFEINKGIDARKGAKNPYLVNRNVPTARRRIPFSHMIYVGDGLTDIPCFSLVKKEGGISFGVFNPGEEASAKRALLEFLQPARVVGVHAPRYRKDDELGALLRAAVQQLCSRVALARQEADPLF